MPWNTCARTEPHDAFKTSRMTCSRSELFRIFPTLKMALIEAKESETSQEHCVSCWATQLSSKKRGSSLERLGISSQASHRHLVMELKALLELDPLSTTLILLHLLQENTEASDQKTSISSAITIQDSSALRLTTHIPRVKACQPSLTVRDLRKFKSRWKKSRKRKRKRRSPRRRILTLMMILLKATHPIHHLKKRVILIRRLDPKSLVEVYRLLLKLPELWMQPNNSSSNLNRTCSISWVEAASLKLKQSLHLLTSCRSDPISNLSHKIKTLLKTFSLHPLKPKHNLQTFSVTLTWLKIPQLSHRFNHNYSTPSLTCQASVS